MRSVIPEQSRRLGFLETSFPFFLSDVVDEGSPDGFKPQWGWCLSESMPGSRGRLGGWWLGYIRISAWRMKAPSRRVGSASLWLADDRLHVMSDVD